MAAAVPPTEFGYTVIMAVLLVLIPLLQTEHVPDERLVIVTVVLPLFASKGVVKVPVPAEVMVIVAVEPVAVFVPDKLYVTV